MRYYDLDADGFDADRWHVSIPEILPGETEWWDVWAFSRCEPYTGHTPVRGLQFEDSGRRTAFTSCSFNAFVVSQKMGDILLSIVPDSVELIPLVIDDEPIGEWFILNILDRVNCIDLEHSKVVFKREDGEQKIRSITYLEILEEKAAGHDIFRLGEFSVQVLVSERVAKGMQASGLDGFLLQALPWSAFGGCG